LCNINALLIANNVVLMPKQQLHALNVNLSSVWHKTAKPAPTDFSFAMPTPV